MTRIVMVVLAMAGLGVGCTGCTGRMIKEGMGVARGASGKVITSRITPDLTRYRGIRVEPIGVAPGLDVPAEMVSLVRKDVGSAAAMRNLMPEAEPALMFSGQIVHYEEAGTIDSAIGPLAETVMHVKLIDVQTGTVIAQANLVGRSKATVTSNPKSLAGGIGKAVDKWLKDGGLKKVDDKE